MPLQLSAAAARRFADAARALAAPHDHDTPDDWRARAAAAVRALLGADRTLFLLPPLRAARAPGAPPAACFYSDDEGRGAAAAHEAFLARTPGRPTDPQEAVLAAILAARHAYGLTAWTGPRFARLPPCRPGGPLHLRRSQFLCDVNVPAGLWGATYLGAGAPGRDALLIAGDRGRASAVFAEGDAVQLAAMLQPAFAAGVRLAVARWGGPPAPGATAAPDASGPHAGRPSDGGWGDDRRLTPREREVAALLAARRTNAEVAAALGVSPHTARHHTERVLQKLGVASRRDVGAAAGAAPRTGPRADGGGR